MFLLLMNQRQQRVDRLAQTAVIIERMAILRSIAAARASRALISLAFSRFTVFQALAQDLRRNL